MLAPDGETRPVAHCWQLGTPSGLLEKKPGLHPLQSSAESCRTACSPSSMSCVPGRQVRQDEMELWSVAEVAWSGLYLPAGEDGVGWVRIGEVVVRRERKGKLTWTNCAR